MTTWKPVCLVGNHLDAMTYDAIRFVRVQDRPEAPHWLFLDATATRQPEEVIRRDAIGYLAVSDDDQALYARLTAYWRERFGDDPPPLYRQSAGTDGLSAALMDMLGGALAASHKRNVQLMRDLGQLRTRHDETQRAFERLEGFLYQTVRAQRSLFIYLPVRPAQPDHRLAPGVAIEQRLPGDSTGLSDIAISIGKSASPGPASGTLNVGLRLMESGAMVAEWSVPGDRLTPGWLQLSLQRALGPDPQTPLLCLSWDGTEPIALQTSFHHPDARFTFAPGAPLLAVQVWKYVPGTLAKLPATAIPGREVLVVDRWSLSRSALQNAVDLSGKGLVEYSDLWTGLVVRPLAGTVSAARLERAGQPGMCHLYGGVKTEMSLGPVVEYAYALAPVSKRPRSARALPEFAAGYRSQWLPMTSNEWSELHLFLKEPLQEEHDLYLLTRLGPDESSDVPVEACFYDITALADTKRRHSIEAPL